ncbi:site-specific integrase [Chryseobacterium sp. WLY505]|uniref:tyrosine-type recombinase/integrase n=1 Tax=Chryseobacterium sp. WLY505 TaxID=3068892 RepID=UPI00279692EA|nr:site-specific integrase [Chryseobacterium sp. WLY505]MDQ1858995.1 site-specific integrase [Chryseobacterium sp. WLY505]
MFKNQMPNGCSYADLFIYPNPEKISNKKVLSEKDILEKKITIKDAMAKEWYVGCKFYDPQSKKYLKGYFWRKKHLAVYKIYEERKAAAVILLDEMQRALDRCYNPIPGVCEFQEVVDTEFHPDLYLFEALEMAFNDHLPDITPGYASSIKSNLTTIKAVITKLQLEHLKIKNTELKHIKKILDNSKLSNNSYNTYKKHLSKLFGILCANSCLVQNPCQYIPTKIHLKKAPKVLSYPMFQSICNMLEEKRPDFATYCQIFHMTGCRSTELLAVKKKDVNLRKREFTITIKKRRGYVREERAIIPDAYVFWKYQLSMCKSEEDYLFGEGFSPQRREKPLRKETPNEYWQDHVNSVYNTGTTFYKLKHLFLDLIESLYGAEAAQGMAGHLNGKTTEIYTTLKKKRELELLKKLTLKKIKGLQ